MNEATLVNFINECAIKLEKQDLPLRVQLSEGATIETIQEAQSQVGSAFPPSMIEFLALHNGMELKSYSIDPYRQSDALIIYSLQEMLRRTISINEKLNSEDYMSHPIDNPPHVLVIGQHLDGLILLQTNGPINVRSREPAARLQWEPLEENWDEIADSYEHWILRSLESMAYTDNGFAYFTSIEYEAEQIRQGRL